MTIVHIIFLFQNQKNNNPGLIFGELYHNFQRRRMVFKWASNSVVLLYFLSIKGVSRCCKFTTSTKGGK